VIMMIEKLVEWLAGETEVLEENPPHWRFVRHKTHMPARTRTLATAVGSRRLTAWATAGLNVVFLSVCTQTENPRHFNVKHSGWHN
jgi:hypothetical protein